MEETRVIEEIKHFIETNILAGDLVLGAETNLQNAGIDSFSIVEIILFIERTYQVSVPDNQLIPENFMTLHSLAQLVKKLSD